MSTEQKQCPECGFAFKGQGYIGIDGHWRGKDGHEDVMPYRVAFALIKEGQYAKGAPILPGSIVAYLIAHHNQHG